MQTAVNGTPAATPPKAWLMRVGIALFTLGLVTVIAVFVLFAAGFSDLPAWLSIAGGVLTPLGLGLGLIALMREHRQQ